MDFGYSDAVDIFLNGTLVLASAKTMAWVEDGVQNAVHHVRTIKKAGINPVVCINAFHFDSEEEHDVIRRACEAEGARVAVSKHWQFGGEGALEFADAVMDAGKETPNSNFSIPTSCRCANALR